MKAPLTATPGTNAEAWKAPDADNLKVADDASASKHLPTIEPLDEVSQLLTYSFSFALKQSCLQGCRLLVCRPATA